jgi:TIR domain
VTLASSIVLLADKNPRELGAVSETELLRGAYPFEELAGLSRAESQSLLDATVLRFLGHNICFRETLGDETLLIFPALIKQKRPLQDDLPSTDDISYVVRGRVKFQELFEQFLYQALHEQWERTLAGPASRRAAEEEGAAAAPFKVFISYARRDEPFKDDPLTVLKPLERRGVLEIWHDRMIEEGDEWRREITSAMNECHMPLLFVSKNFLASAFIQDDELPPLLRRRREEGLRVVPIIVGPCMWQSEPALKDLQALPRNGKPVIKFPKANGARDQVWSDIAAVEKRAKAKTTV